MAMMVSSDADANSETKPMTASFVFVTIVISGDDHKSTVK
jgi:hypothetical protein